MLTIRFIILLQWRTQESRTRHNKCTVVGCSIHQVRSSYLVLICLLINTKADKNGKWIKQDKCKLCYAFSVHLLCSTTGWCVNIKRVTVTILRLCVVFKKVCNAMYIYVKLSIACSCYFNEVNTFWYLNSLRLQSHTKD